MIEAPPDKRDEIVAGWRANRLQVLTAGLNALVAAVLLIFLTDVAAVPILIGLGVYEVITVFLLWFFARRRDEQLREIGYMSGAPK